MAVKRIGPEVPKGNPGREYAGTLTPINVITNFIYLFHTDEWLLLPEYPDQVSDSMTSTFSQTNALSRTAPVFTYSNSGPRRVQVQLNLHRDMLYDLNYKIANFRVDVGEDYVSQLIKKIQAVTLPVYNKEILGVNPPMVALRLGKEIFIKGVVVGTMSVQYQKPIMVDDRYANATLNFDVYEVDPYDAISVGEQGSFRGITKVFYDGLINNQGRR